LQNLLQTQSSNPSTRRQLTLSSLFFHSDVSGHKLFSLQRPPPTYFTPSLFRFLWLSSYFSLDDLVAGIRMLHKKPFFSLLTLLLLSVRVPASFVPPPLVSLTSAVFSTLSLLISSNFSLFSFQPFLLLPYVSDLLEKTIPPNRSKIL